MSALEVGKDESVRAEDTVVIIDCGRASERTRGFFIGWATELAQSPNNWWISL